MPDTYTSQFSGEEIDAALRAAQIISGASTPAELRKKLEIRGDTIPVSATDPTPVSEALTASGGGINPNLLDNWFFGNPVNQKGQTEYTAAGYTIDKWKFNNNNSDIVIDDTGIMFTAKYQYAEFEQRYEFPKNISGKQITMSILADSFSGEGDFYLVIQNQTEYQTFHLSVGLNSFTTKFFDESSVLRLFIQGQNVNETNPPKIHLLAAKLELGDTQTLAHKNGGVWVLNEIPDFGEQLRRCQRHAFSPLYEAYATAIICNLFVSSVANGVAFGEVTLPVSMRNKPVFSGNASKFWIVAENGGGASHPTAISVMGLSADKVMIQVNGSYTANTQYILYVEDPFTSADFLLSADL